MKELIAAGFKKIDNNFGVIDGKVSNVKSKLVVCERQLAGISYKLDSLDGSTTKGLNDVGDRLENLTDEIQKINIVTRYDEIYKNQRALN